jgi:Kdo2-lipid IVA lauroyltransferase/acyltransferase
VFRWKKIRQKLEAFLARFAFFILPLIPYSILVRFSKALGFIAYYVALSERKVALANLELALGDSHSLEDREKIARRSFQSFARTTLETFTGEKVLDRNFKNKDVYFAPGSLELLKELCSRNKGLIALTFHYGNWEWLSLSWGLAGFPITGVAQRIKNPAVQELFQQTREHTGHHLVGRKGGALPLYRALRKKQIVGLLVDLSSSWEEGGDFYNFFGVPALTTRSVGLFATLTGAPVVCSVAHPEGPNRYRIEVGPEISYNPQGPAEEEIDRITQAWLNCCEKVIRDKPEHWMWMYKRWKVRLRSEQEKYPFYSFYHPQAKRSRMLAET